MPPVAPVTRQTAPRTAPASEHRLADREGNDHDHDGDGDGGGDADGDGR